MSENEFTILREDQRRGMVENALLQLEGKLYEAQINEALYDRDHPLDEHGTTIGQTQEILREQIAKLQVLLAGFDEPAPEE